MITRTLDALYRGGPCPDTACDGRVYKKAVPGVVIRITGGSMIQATGYNLERYRCNLCLETDTASKNLVSVTLGNLGLSLLSSSNKADGVV